MLTIFGVVGRFFVKQKFYYWIAYVFGILTLAVLIYVAASKVLKPYQIQRLIIFLDPSIDAQNSGYHIIQSAYTNVPCKKRNQGLQCKRKKGDKDE